MHRPTALCKLSLTATLFLLVEIGLAIAPAAFANESTHSLMRSSNPLLVAQRRGVYVPPPPGGPIGSGTTGGVRGGCSSNSTVPLLALAPRYHQGQTATTRPTLAWYVPDTTPHQLVFQLYEGEAQEALHDVTLTSQPGIMTWSLPEDAPELKVGETYRWRVIMLCDTNRPSRTVRDTVYLTVTAPSSNVEPGLRDRAPVAYASALASEGLWYDALAATLLDAAQPELRSLRQTLLVELASLEESESTTNSAYAESLRQVAAEQ